MSKRREKGLKCLACGKPLTGNQRYWCSEACRHWYARNERVSSGFERVSSGFERVSSGFESKTGSFFPEKRIRHDIAILRKKIDPSSTGTLSRDFVITLRTKFLEKYDTKRSESELYALVNHKILQKFVKKLLEDYNPGWLVEVTIEKKKPPKGDDLE